MRLRTFLTYLSLLPLSACTKSCQDYDNNEEFARARLPAYTETGAGTLGCMLGAQTWTVLGKSYQNGGLGNPWFSNILAIEGSYLVPSYLGATGRMTGVRDSKTFYDMELSFAIQPTDTLGGLHLLGADTLRNPPPTAGRMLVRNMLTYGEQYSSQSRRPVRLLVRKLDKQQRIISGTFDGWLYGGASGHDSISVADGRFDLTY
jgi:hypothetical protein